MNSNEISNNFNGIWNRDNIEQEMLNVAGRMADEKPAVGSIAKIQKEKSWGVGSAIGVLLLSFVTVSILSAALIFFEPNLEKLTKNPLFLLANGIVLNGTWILGMLYVSKKRGTKSFKKDYKLQFKIRDIFIGLGLAASLFIIVQLSAALFQNLGLDLTGSDNGSAFASMQGIWFIIVGIGVASIMGPISEELFFRGMLLQGVINTINNQKKYFTKISTKTKTFDPEKFSKFLTIITYPTAIIISSIIFGFMHYQGYSTFGEWYVVIATGTLGLFFGIFRVVFNRLGPVIYAHMFYNAATLIIGVLSTS